MLFEHRNLCVRRFPEVNASAGMPVAFPTFEHGAYQQPFPTDMLEPLMQILPDSVEQCCRLLDIYHPYRIHFSQVVYIFISIQVAIFHIARVQGFADRANYKSYYIHRLLPCLDHPLAR